MVAVVRLLKKGMEMGKERSLRTRITFFVPDSLALQIKESAYNSRKTLTDYMIEAVVEKIKKEREYERSDAVQEM